MLPEPLHRPFIAIALNASDYTKVKGLLPTPSFSDTLHSYCNQKIILIYVLEGYIITSKQFRLVSNIKLGLQMFLFVRFEFIDEFHVTDTTEVNNIIYSIDELSKAFKAPLITYPKIMFPSTKKDVYRRLCWYGERLIHQKVFTKESMISAALLMNKKLNDKYQKKELHKKALGAYLWLVENIDGFKVGLDKIQLREAHSRGARIKNHNQAQKTQEKIDALIKTGDFFKPNGKVNISKLAKAVNNTRKTVAKYV